MPQLKNGGLHPAWYAGATLIVVPFAALVFVAFAALILLCWPLLPVWAYLDRVKEIRDAE